MDDPQKIAPRKHVATARRIYRAFYSTALAIGLLVLALEVFGTAAAVLIFAVCFPAFCVWLTVRIVNRRERWAKWTLVAAIILPTLYVLSVGPAMWLCGGEKYMPEWLLAIYWPFRVIPDGPDFIEDAFVWYLGLWAR